MTARPHLHPALGDDSATDQLEVGRELGAVLRCIAATGDRVPVLADRRDEALSERLAFPPKLPLAGTACASYVRRTATPGLMGCRHHCRDSGSPTRSRSVAMPSTSCTRASSAGIRDDHLRGLHGRHQLAHHPGVHVLSHGSALHQSSRQALALSVSLETGERHGNIGREPARSHKRAGGAVLTFLAYGTAVSRPTWTHDIRRARGAAPRGAAVPSRGNAAHVRRYRIGPHCRRR